MIPVGYMAKRINPKPVWLNAPHVLDVYSVGNCSSEDFADYINFWKHNGYWLFDSPAILQAVAKENAISLAGTKLFYYEAHEEELADQSWRAFSPDATIPTNVLIPSQANFQGFDVVTFMAGNAPEHSPLSCNGLAEDIPTNSHCLLDSFAEAETYLNNGRFNGCEPGPYRIFAVYSVPWPSVPQPLSP